MLRYLLSRKGQLHNTHIADTDLRDVDLRDADLPHTNLFYIDLSYTDLFSFLFNDFIMTWLYTHCNLIAITKLRTEWSAKFIHVSLETTAEQEVDYILTSKTRIQSVIRMWPLFQDEVTKPSCYTLPDGIKSYFCSHCCSLKNIGRTKRHICIPFKII